MQNCGGKNHLNKKGLILLSGGLDSVLSAKLLLNQGVEVEAVKFTTVFFSSTDEVKRVCDEFGMKLHIIDVTDEYLKMVKEPRYGYGKNINPCIDCKIFMLKKAKGLLKTLSASFVVTGEVLGERPMSQRRDAINLIEKRADLKGLILRPLSAKHFEPTLAEKEGIVKRELLLDIKGRSRKPQIALAEELGITEYLAPAGGCLLTDPGFARRMKDLIANDEYTLPNIKLLKVGRHFRTNGTKIVIGRDKEDNKRMLSSTKEGDVIVKTKDFAGPITVVRGNGVHSSIKLAAALTAGHTKGRDAESVVVECRVVPDGKPQLMSVRPLLKENVELEAV